MSPVQKPLIMTRRSIVHLLPANHRARDIIGCLKTPLDTIFKVLRSYKALDTTKAVQGAGRRESRVTSKNNKKLKVKRYKNTSLHTAAEEMKNLKTSLQRLQA